MDIFFRVVLLGIVQGITEFLPISSSGHLAIFQKYFGFQKQMVAFDVFLHLGSVLAILVFLRKKIFQLIINWRKNLRIFFLLFLASIPVGIIGFLLKKQIEEIFLQTKLIAASFLITAGLLFSTKFVKEQKEKSLKEIKLLDSFLVGIFQALAILPGVSRSGATITGGLWVGFSSETAFYFSFLLAVPAILGATVMKFPELVLTGIKPVEILLALLISSFTSYLSLNLLTNFLKEKKLYLFGFYCVLMAIILFLL